MNFPADHLKNDQSPDSVLHEKQHEEDVDNINYPPPWKWEKYFIGGYSQGRMLKFKNPNTMYKAINLFAGVAIMFYGYDQGVMSQVNLNEDYWNHSMFETAFKKSTRILTLHQWASILQKTPNGTLPQKVALSLSTMEELSSALSLLDLWPTDAEESRLLSLAPCGLYSVRPFKLPPTTSPGCAVPESSLALALERLIV